MQKILVLCSVVMAIGVVGCGTQVTPGDSGVLPIDGGPDGGPGRDVGPDAVVADAGPDGGASCSATNCTGEHACVRGVCVATCGADATGFEAALAADLVVVGATCRRPGALGYANGAMYELSSETTGLETTFTLSRWMPGSEAPAATPIATAHYTAPDATTMVFSGGYVAVSSDGMHAVFGYTTSAAGAIGGVFDVATGDGAVIEVPAAGNFDATFVDATHYVVDGTIGGTQGLYQAAAGGMTWAAAVAHVGDYSGSVDLWAEESVLLVGGTAAGTPWADGELGDRVLVVETSALGGTAPVDGRTVQQLVLPSAFELLAGGRIASVHYDASFAVDSLVARPLTRDAGGTVTVGAATNLTTGSTFTNVTSAGTDTVLWFDGGLLFVR